MNSDTISNKIQFCALLFIRSVLEMADINKFNPLNVELNPICHLLALLGAHYILHVSRIRIKVCAEGLC